MKHMQLFRRGINLNKQAPQRLSVNGQPPLQRTRDSTIARAVQPRKTEYEPKQASKQESPSVPELGWLWSGGKGTSASAAVADLRQDRIKPKKSLGQNFVTDDGILESIVKASGVKPGDLVLEVGPGTGNLTRHLLAAGARVTAVEKDDTLYARLVETFGEHTKDLTVVHGDVLDVNLKQILQDMVQQSRAQAGGSAEASSPRPSPPASPSASLDVVVNAERSTDSATASPDAAASTSGSPAISGVIKVVANLPYNITKDFLKVLLPMGALVSELHIMIQEEVARRLITKKPGGPDYRAMNLYVMYYSKPVYRFIIPKDRYFPVPGVDGALVSFKLMAPDKRPAVPSERSFIGLVNKGFAERRKMLRNNLQPMYTSQQIEQALSAIGHPVTARAQDLYIDDFVHLHQHLDKVGVAAAAASAVNKLES